MKSREINKQPFYQSTNIASSTGKILKAWGKNKNDLQAATDVSVFLWGRAEREGILGDRTLQKILTSLEIKRAEILDDKITEVSLKKISLIGEVFRSESGTEALMPEIDQAGLTYKQASEKLRIPFRVAMGLLNSLIKKDVVLVASRGPVFKLVK